MKYLLFFIAIILSLSINSCEKRIVAGKYVYSENGSYFEIDKENNYNFSTNGDVHQRKMFSKGKVKLNDGEVNFMPDSSYFFHISVVKHYYDQSLKKNRKIIIVCSNNIINDFHFTFQNGGSDSTIDFENKTYVIYKPMPESYEDGSITFEANLRDTSLILPRLLHKFIISNTIHFFDVNNDDPNNNPWNVVEFNMTINRDMFSFTTIPPYILKSRRLIKKEWPVYELKKK